jgi:hypothetical protein
VVRRLVVTPAEWRQRKLKGGRPLCGHLMQSLRGEVPCTMEAHHRTPHMHHGKGFVVVQPHNHETREAA